MSEINLKKLLTRKEVASTIREFIDESSIAITDVLGNLILGEIRDTCVERFPLKIAEEVLVGWIIGDKQARTFIPIISYILNQEIEKKNLAQEVLSKYQEINLFYRLSERITSVLELELVVKLVIEEARKLIKTSNGSIMLLNRATGVLEVVSAFGAEACGVPVMPGRDIAGDIFSTGIAEIVNDVLSDNRFIPTKNPISSLICAPLKTRDKVIGIIIFSNQDPVTYTASDLKLFAALAGQAAKAIENSLLYAEKEEYAQTLEQKIKDIKRSEFDIRQKSQELEKALQNLRQAQLQIVQSEKMSALGNLVAGVAHEINNPIGFIDGNLNQSTIAIQDVLECLQLYQKHFPVPGAEITAKIEEIELDYLFEDIPKMLGSMQIGCDRIKAISTSLRVFSRADQEIKVPGDIHAGIDSTLMILQHRLKAGNSRPVIQVIRNYGNIPQVNCFLGQLNQVFMNIFANAIDSFDTASQNLTLAEIEANPQQIMITTELIPDQELVVIKIKDNGEGMPESVRTRVFDHLFTTKDVGVGTGLGLAIAWQIVVDKHQGTLEANSAAGQGAEFVITLPIVGII
jgi:signal transduction histidine kinase